LFVSEIYSNLKIVPFSYDTLAREKIVTMYPEKDTSSSGCHRTPDVTAFYAMMRARCDIIFSQLQTKGDSIESKIRVRIEKLRLSTTELQFPKGIAERHNREEPSEEDRQREPIVFQLREKSILKLYKKHGIPRRSVFFNFCPDQIPISQYSESQC